MTSLRSFVLSAALLTTGLFGIVGCDSVDAAFDCQSVCDRYLPDRPGSVSVLVILLLA